MNARLITITGIMLMVLPAIALAANTDILPVTPGATGSDVNVDVLAKRADGLTLELGLTGLARETVTVDGKVMDNLSFTDGGLVGAEGQPGLPTVTRLVALPTGSGIQVKIIDLETRSLGAMNPAPVEAVTDQNKMAMPFDASWYAAAPASQPSVEVGEPALMHGVRVVPVTFKPLGYDPITGEVTAAGRMTVEISFTGRDDRNNPSGPVTMIPESFALMYEQEIVGWERDANVNVGPGSYIMICPDNSSVVNIVEKLADWRRRQGYTVQVVTTATTGPSNTNIKSWLQTQYANANPPLEFVTLVGDANGSVSIPTFHESYSGYGGEGDHDYTLLNGGDVLSDVHLGRLSVTNTSMLQDVVDKIVDYESTPDMSDTSWFTTAGLTGDPASSGASCIFTNQFVKEQLQNLDYTRIDTIWSSPFLSQMMSTINQGESLFTYRGYLNMSGMGASHINSLSNGQQLPYAVILTCYTGSFEDETTCRSEAFLRAPNGGGVASIGTATTGTHTRYNNCIFLGVTNGVLDTGDQRVGPSLTRGKLNLYKNYNRNEWEKVWTWCTWNNLMGDPATEIWTAVPADLDVSYAAQVALGANALPVTVTSGGSVVAGARVAVYQDGNVADFAYTDITGSAVLSIDGAASGDVLVTVTGQNLHPHLGETAVGTVARSLDFDGLTISEVSGNGDNLLNPGEVADLQVQLRNNGTNSVSAGTAQLINSLPYVTILDADASLGTVAAGGTATATFQVRIELDAPGGVTGQQHLEASGSGDSWTSLVGLEIHGPLGQFNRLTFNGDLEPGGSGTAGFDLFNVGNLTTSGISATMTCASRWVLITDPNGGWGSINPGSQSNQNDLFSFDVAGDCLTGHVANLIVTLEFNEGGTQVLEYPVTIGTADTGDPTGPDTYGYYAFDNLDNSDMAPDYNWVELAGIGTNTGINDSSRHDDETRQFDMPFDFTYYGETFDRVSICSNGWLSFGDTNIKLYRNWILPADGSPDAMICAFWDDLAQGTIYHHYDEANHRYIVQWDDFGSYNGNYGGNCTFEIILYDPAHHPTDTGDGLIVMQYQAVTVQADESTRFTTGIQDRSRTVGLTYVYGNDYPDASASVVANRAIAFLPVIPQAQGTLQGEVANASDGNAALEGATISVLGGGRQLVTSADGFYSGSVTIGTYDVAVYHDSFAPDTTYNVAIIEDEITEVDFALTDIRGPYIEDVTQLADTQNTSGPYSVEANITDMTGVDSYMLHYTSSSTGGPFAVALTLENAATGLVSGDIPGQPDGTRVQYWLTAGDVLGNTSAAPAGAPWPTFGFNVAEVTVIATDDGEDATGWNVNMQGSDSATAGIWENADPVGSTYNSVQVQTDSDHTPAPGTNCWITGQHVDGESAGYNDVDGGATSVTSPAFDLSGYGSVEVSYWRWFTNDSGNNPGGGTWNVQVSGDGGSSWANVENTTSSNNSWQHQSFMVNDHVDGPLGQTLLRFSASDDGEGSLVEAAFDDIEISAASTVVDTEAPTVTVTAPNGGIIGQGQVLNVGWNASDDVGVVHARVWLSLDGGSTFDALIAEGALDGAAEWVVNVPTDQSSYDARVRVDVLDGMEREGSDVSNAFTINVTVNDTPAMGSVLTLAQNHPNPFNPQTSIFYNLPRNMDVSLRIYDLQGKLIRTLVQGPVAAGSHEAVWKGQNDRGGNVSSGIYFYRLSTDQGELVRKMTLLK